jgi:hypothetical protein
VVNDEKTIEHLVSVKLQRLEAKIVGIICGTLAGLVVFIATNWLVLKGGERVGPHLALLRQYFIGYKVTFFGSFVGFAYAFVCGFLAGYCFARMYNWLASRREKN